MHLCAKSVSHFSKVPPSQFYEIIPSRDIRIKISQEFVEINVDEGNTLQVSCIVATGELPT